jgi:MFS family permease
MLTAAPPAGPASARLHYAWLVAGVTFLVLLIGAGVRSIPGILIVPLEHEFGWTRATLSLAVSINLLLYGLFGPFAAAIMERFGIRRLIAGGLLLMVVALTLATQMKSAWQLVLIWGLLVGIGTGTMASWLAATVANRWFTAHRGVVIGLLSSSAGTGQLIFLPSLAWLVVHVGWRIPVLVMAALALALIPLVLAAVRNYPRDKGLAPFGSQTIEQPPARGLTGNPFKSAIEGLGQSMRNSDFRILAASFFICGATTNGLIGTHLIPASIEHGISEVTAASFLAVIGAVALVGTTLSGWLSDRFDNRWLLCWYYTGRGLSLLFLPYAYGRGFFGLLLFVTFYGLDWITTVPPTVRLAADLLGRDRVSTNFAWIFAAHQLGSSIAAFGAGALRTWLGNYQIAFMSAGLLCLVAAGIVIRLNRPGGAPVEPLRPIDAEAPAYS